MKRPIAEVKRVSEWTPWLVANASRDSNGVGRTEVRHRLVCKTRMADSRQMEAQVRTETRRCLGGGDCSGEEEEAGRVGWWTGVQLLPPSAPAYDEVDGGGTGNNIDESSPKLDAFLGYCQCRDLGLYRTCVRCNQVNKLPGNKGKFGYR